MEPIVIWRITDGKAGHESQTRGLADALARLRPVECLDVAAPSRLRSAAMWLSGRFPPGAKLSDPGLILAAGHRTHPAALAARRARGGRIVVLMKPSLPCDWFDLCLIPRHDGVAASERVVGTVGALNPVRAARSASPDRGLILIGGPSAHHDWDEDGMLAQVRRVVVAMPGVCWVLTTSPRTPPGTTAALRLLEIENVEVVPFEETQPGWVAKRLEACATAWVTEDSVSMVFESLTSGAAVGLLPVPVRKKASRVVRSVELLLEEGRAVRLPADGAVPVPPRQVEVLAEADRCAALVLRRLAGPGAGPAA